jgi:hypothetical protein
VPKRALIAAVVSGVALAIALVVAGLSVIAAYVAAFGLTTFLTYGYDKLQAKRGGRA